MSDKTCEFELEDGHRCRKEAIVGWGNPAQWLCSQHFIGALAQTRKIIGSLENMMRASFPDETG